MIFYYTALGTFDKSCKEEGMSWSAFLNWSKINELTELVSLDRMLNKTLVEPNYNSEDDWNFIVVDDSNKFETGFYKTVEYVLRRKKETEIFNLLAVVVEPKEDCKKIDLGDFEFIGYELLDKEYGNSALTNCGGFNETFSPNDLNMLGLISDYKQAFDIKKRLLANNPQEHHADTNVIAIWRHKSVGGLKENIY